VPPQFSHGWPCIAHFDQSVQEAARAIRRSTGSRLPLNVTVLAPATTSSALPTREMNAPRVYRSLSETVACSANLSIPFCSFMSDPLRSHCESPR
jgi:hypothetical protein